MRGPGLVGYEPSAVRWSGDSQRVYFHWKQASDPLLKDMDTYVVNRDGSGLRRLSEQDAHAAPPEFGASSPDKRATIYVRDGDVFIDNGDTGRTRQITRRVMSNRILTLFATETQSPSPGGTIYLSSSSTPDTWSKCPIFDPPEPRRPRSPREPIARSSLRKRRRTCWKWSASVKRSTRKKRLDENGSTHANPSLSRPGSR